MVGEPLTVACSMWRGWQPIYDHTHVNALGRRVEKFLPGVNFVCFTNQPKGIKYRTHPIPSAPRLPSHHGRNCYWRTWFFSEACHREFPGRIMNIDLDSMILGDMTPLVTNDDFRILRANVCPYNGGFWLHRTGTRKEVWSTLSMPALRALRRDPKARKWVGSDQAWLAWKLPGAPLYTEADGCYFIMAGDHKNPEKALEKMNAARVVFFPGAQGVKPWSNTVKNALPFVYEKYMEFYE